MARLYRGSPSESSGTLIIEEYHPNCVEIYFVPSVDKLEAAGCNPDDANKYKTKILFICGQDDYMSIFPINTFPDHEDFLKPKYDKIRSITLDGFDYETPDTIKEVMEILEYLPSGFIKNYNFGLGLQKDYRFIIDAVEEIKDIQHIVISKKTKTKLSVETGTCTISFKEYDEIRKKINAVSNRAQSAARKIKSITAHNVLAHFLDSPQYPQKPYIAKNDTLSKLISSPSDVSEQLSKSEQEIVIKLFSKNKAIIAEEQPEELIKLRNDIEVVTLERLIDKFEEMLGKKLSETRWQKLFNDNPFILNLAFGYPVIKIQDQAHVGGRKLSGAGEKITDFLVKNGISNNAALFEIKTPSTPLLNKRAYRENLYTPSSDLAGAINQMLDQKNKFQKEISMLKENSRINNLESYAVHGVLIIGNTPKDIDQQKSFELFRGNSKDIAIITFDELLEKLKLLREFLSSNQQEVTQVSILHNLETKVVKMKHELHELFQHTKVSSGSYTSVTSNPLPGIDSASVTSAIGRLAILEHGFDRVRLLKPPYPVSFDESGQHAVKVKTLDEFIAQSEKVIADVKAVLATQNKTRT